MLLLLLAPVCALGQNCPSGFTTSGGCGVSFIGTGGKAWAVVGSNQGTTPGLVGSSVQLIQVPPNGHLALSMIYQSLVNVQSFTWTTTFTGDGHNIAFMIENANNLGHGSPFDGLNMSAGAGCEGGFFQAFGPSPNNIIVINLDSANPISGTTFTYSNAQVYQSQQDPCNPPYVSGYPTTKLSTFPVPLNSPPSSQLTSTGDTYSTTISYDGTNLNLCLYDVTLANGSCSSGTSGTGVYFQKTWTAVNIPSMVGGNTAYIGFTGGSNSDAPTSLYINSSVYTVNTPPSSPTLSTYTTTANAGASYATAPVFTPAAGSYSGTQSVTISNSTSGSYFCYILAASTPSVFPWPDSVGGCPVGTLYTGPISVASTQTLYAVAGTSQFIGLPSAQVSGAYVIGTPTAATPTFSPAAGTYTSPQSVTIACTTPSNTIYYTTDGSTPTTGSTVYMTPVSVGSSLTMRAICTAPGYSTSAVGSAAYTLNLTAATPTFNPVAGTYPSAQSVVIASTTAGATICYTTDGTTPAAATPGTCSRGNTYSGAVSVATSLTMQAIATESGYTNSAVASAVYTISPPVANTPTFTPPGGPYTSPQTVTLASASPSGAATICYTTDGSTPTAPTPGTCGHGATYSTPITVSVSETIMAIATEVGFVNSSVGSATYVISIPTVANPTFTPAPVTLSSPFTVTLATTTPGATLCYTVNGSAPTATAGVCGGGSTTYTTPISITSGNYFIQAIGSEAGYNNSGLAAGNFGVITISVEVTLANVVVGPKVVFGGN
jgi:hypothetical protein